MADLEAIAERIERIAASRAAPPRELLEARARYLQRKLNLPRPRAAMLLLYLADCPGQVCRYDEIEREIGGHRNALAVYTTYIRTALASYGLTPAITVEKGKGYCLSQGAAALVKALLNAESEGAEPQKARG